MASLVPCPACQRHLRRAEIECPFCGARRTAAGPFVEAAIPRDLKRATLFAIGLTLAGQACGGKSEGDNDQGPSGAGASAGISNGGTGGNAAGGTGSTGGFNAFAGSGNTPTDYATLVPPYGGVPFPPGGSTSGTAGSAGSAGSTGMPDPDPAEDAGVNDAGGDAAPDDAGD